MKNMRIITSKEELNSKAVYYSEEYKRVGNKHCEWKKIYDKDFNVLEEIKTLYGSETSELQRIADEKNKDDYSLMAYDLENLGNGFYLVKKNDDTKAALVAMAESVK